MVFFVHLVVVVDLPSVFQNVYIFVADGGTECTNEFVQGILKGEVSLYH